MNDNQAANPVLEGSPSDEQIGQSEQMSALEQQIDELETKLQETELRNNQLMRIAADFENYKRRQEKEKEDLIKFAAERVIRHLLEVFDNFDRAMQVEVKAEEYKNFVQGIQMIHKQFTDMFQKIGVAAIDAVGKTFDPELHEAISSEPSEEHADDTVLAEFQKGYVLNGKVIRPAMVKVASNN